LRGCWQWGRCGCHVRDELERPRIHELVHRQWLPHSRSHDRASTLVYYRLQPPPPDRVVDAKHIDHHPRQALNLRLRALRAFA